MIDVFDSLENNTKDKATQYCLDNKYTHITIYDDKYNVLVYRCYKEELGNIVYMNETRLFT